jgi:hypothetical protein
MTRCADQSRHHSPFIVHRSSIHTAPNAEPVVPLHRPPVPSPAAVMITLAPIASTAVVRHGCIPPVPTPTSTPPAAAAASPSPSTKV